MTEDVLFRTEERCPRAAIADVSREAADPLESSSVRLRSDTDERQVAIPDGARVEVERERVTASKTGDQRYELGGTNAATHR